MISIPIHDEWLRSVSAVRIALGSSMETSAPTVTVPAPEVIPGNLIRVAGKAAGGYRVIGAVLRKSFHLIVRVTCACACRAFRFAEGLCARASASKFRKCRAAALAYAGGLRL